MRVPGPHHVPATPPDWAVPTNRPAARTAPPCRAAPSPGAEPPPARPDAPAAPADGGATAGSVALDLTQLGLDVAGIFDPTPICDGVNGLISLGRGDWSGALISGVSMVPYAGDAAKLERLGGTLDKVADLVRASPDAAGALRAPLEELKSLLDRAPTDELPDALREPVQALKGKLDEALGAVNRTEPTPVAAQAGGGAPSAAGGAEPAANTGRGAEAPRAAAQPEGAAATPGADAGRGAAGGAHGAGGMGGESRPAASGPDEPGHPRRPDGAGPGRPETGRVGDALGGHWPWVKTTTLQRVHILDGNGRPGEYSGGHAPGTRIEGKQDFPEGWDDDKIIREVEDVANDPTSVRYEDPDPESDRIRVEGRRDGVDIRVVLEPNRLDVVTAHPTNLVPNPPEGGGHSHPGRRGR